MGLAGFACVMLVVLFLLINKYGRHSKFGMKGKERLVQGGAFKSVSLCFCSLSVVLFCVSILRFGHLSQICLSV